MASLASPKTQQTSRRGRRDGRSSSGDDDNDDDRNSDYDNDNVGRDTMGEGSREERGSGKASMVRMEADLKQPTLYAVPKDVKFLPKHLLSRNESGPRRRMVLRNNDEFRGMGYALQVSF